jgi:hypothetical protein
MANSIFLRKTAAQQIGNVQLTELARALDGDCFVPFNTAEISAVNDIVAPYSKPSQGALSLHYADNVHAKLPTYVAGDKGLNVLKDYSSSWPIAQIVSGDYPLVSKGDIGPVSPAAIGNATAGSGIIGTIDLDGVINGATVDGYTTKRTVFGYLVKIDYTQNDLGDVLQITDGANTIATWTANDDDCMTLYLFLPVASSASVTQTDSGLQFTWGASGITITFQVSGATDLGGWTIQTQPIYVTSEIVSNIVPLQTVSGNYIFVEPGC